MEDLFIPYYSHFIVHAEYPNSGRDRLRIRGLVGQYQAEPMQLFALVYQLTMLSNEMSALNSNNRI